MATCDCPIVDGKAFDGVEEDWSGKTFYFRKTPLIFHIPLRIGKDIERVISEAREKGYNFDDDARLMQKDAVFCAQVLLEVDEANKADPNVLVMPPGTKAVATYFEGPWSKLMQPTKKVLEAVKAKGEQTKALYFWYLTCPVCSKERGYQTVVWATY